MKKLLLFTALAAFAPVTRAAVTPVAHYNLKGQGGIRDTAAPLVWKSLVAGGPDLMRQGTPKIMSNAPPARRAEFDSAVKFEQNDQCYAAPQNLVRGDNFVVEVWAYAAKARDEGWHAVLANGHGGSGFLIAQNDGEWKILVGGVGDVSLGAVQAETWTHLAIVKRGGAVTGWRDGRKQCEVPNLGGGAANFSLGATAPGREAFSGWIAEARYATFQAGKFDPASDFLLDNQRMKALQTAEIAARVQFIDSLLTVPGALAVQNFDEKPAVQDWLISPPSTSANVQIKAAANRQSAEILLSNGLVSRKFFVTDGNLACVSFRRSDKDIEFVRSLKPEVRLRLNGGGWSEIGGLQGAPDHAFIAPQWLENLQAKSGAFVFTGLAVGLCAKPYEWQPKCNAPQNIAWPAKGCRLTLHFAPPPGAAAPLNSLKVDVIYELYDGLPVMMKSFALRNEAAQEVTVTQFEGEHLAVQPTNSRLLHVESDYSFALANAVEQGSALGLHFSGGKPEFYDYSFGGGTTRFVRDPDWGSMATLNPAEDLFLDNPQNALLLSRPSVGPNWSVKPGEVFNAFRTFEILNDSAERERFHLAQRRFYKKLAPQTNEHQFEVHAPVTRDLKTLGPLLDQMAQVGFELLQAPEHPGGFNYADTSPGNIAAMKAICDYAKAKNIRVGAYQLMMASQGWGRPEDNFNCISPATGKPGSIFGQSACGASAWADMYFENMWQTIEGAGMGAFKPDGPYHGDPCAATNHPHHKGLEDSQWAQWQWMCRVLREGQRRNLYLTVPDWYFLNGQVCIGMGYREATDNIDIVLQTVLYRQYIFDATWHKTAGMGWVNLNTEVLRGGMEKNLDQYERALFVMLSSGAQVWVRGHRLYDGPQSEAMLKKWMAWYRKYRAIIQGDIIHLRRPDGRGLDYYLHVNPDNREKGMLLVFNPTAAPVQQQITVPLYYTGLTQSARIREQEGKAKTFALSRDFSVNVPVNLPANGYTWLIVE